MARFAILGALALAAVWLSEPALAADDICLTLITVGPGTNDDPSFHKTRIAACTEYLRGDLPVQMRAQALVNRAQSYVALRSYPRALLDIQQATKIVPDSPDVILALGLVYEGLGYAALALPQIEAAIHLGNASSVALANRAYVKSSLGLYGDAIADANLAIAEDASNYVGYGARGFSEEQLGQMSNAVQDLTKAIAGDPNEPSLYHYRGVALYGLDRYQEALDDIEHAYQISPGEKGRTYEDELRAILTAAKTADTPPVEGNAPARAVGRTHNCNAYFPFLQMMLGGHGDVIIHYALSAIGTISSAGIEQSSGNEELDRAAVMCVNTHWRSTAAMRNGNPIATQQGARIVFTEPAERPSPSARADLMAQLGRYDDAIAACDESVAADPKDANTYFQRGLLQYFKADYATATRDFEQALALKPDFDDAKAGQELVKAALLSKVPGHDI